MTSPAPMMLAYIGVIGAGFVAAKAVTSAVPPSE